MPHDITIVAGGWSVKQIDLNRLPGLVIGVNDSSILIPRCDIALSMDRLWTENRAQILRERQQRAYLRSAAVKNVSLWFEAQTFECDYKTGEMSDTPGILNGGNSGICALNLAYQIRPKRVFLCGFDMSKGPNGESHWYSSYVWAPGGATSAGRYLEWAQQFVPAAEAFASAGVAVFNVSPSKAIKTFPRINPEQFEAMACN